MDIEEISKISGQFKGGQWPQFIESISIDGLRGWKGQTVHFGFPVVAIVGENGTGKSTFLKAAACAYDVGNKKEQFSPADFFVVTQWDKVEGVTIKFSVRQADKKSEPSINKPTKRWRFPQTLPSRKVFLQDVLRTLPLDATAGYARIAKLAKAENSSESLTEEYRKWLSYILGRDYSQARFVKSDVSEVNEVGIVTKSGNEISQFHQGAGEDATLDLMRYLQSVPAHSLVIIDEVEASLHPKAQRRLIRFLLWFCRQKRVQIILSTHSPYIFEELPEEARILLLPGSGDTNIVYGASAEFALSWIDDKLHPDLHIFVEDREAAVLLREILASTE